MRISKPATVPWPVRHLPICRSAGQFPMDVPVCNHTYSHPTFALHLNDYAGIVWIAGKLIRLQPGDITLTPPDAESRYALPESGTHLCIHFEPAPAKGDRPAIRLPLHFRPGTRLAAARERFWRVTDFARQAGESALSAAGAAASASLQELLLWIHLQGLSKRRALRQGRAEDALVRLRTIIDASLAKQLGVPDLARQAGLSADYLSRLFRQRHAMSIPRYLLLRRLELARHLLRSTTLPIREVGRQTGIPDAQYFNKQFRRIVGESPSAYRSQRRARARPRRSRKT